MKNNIFYADMHCDTLTELESKGQKLIDNNLHISLKNADKYKFYCQVFAVWNPDELKGNERFLNLKSKHETLKKELSENQNLFFCTKYSDLKKAQNENKTAVFFAIEGGGALDGKIENLYSAYDMGIRFITLTWNGSNEIADGVMCENPKGLHGFGKEVLQIMEHLSIIPDVSHLSEKAFWQLCEIYKKPFLATHSNAKKICPHVRNLTDEQLIFMRDRNCLVGINLCPAFLSVDIQNCNVYDIINHTDYMLSLGMENNLAMGCDLDGVNSLPNGIENISDIEKIYHEFIKHGYKKELADKIFFKNFEGFLEKNLY